MYKKLMQAGALAVAVGLAAPALAAEPEVVARINGDPITRAEIEAMVSQSSGGQAPALNPRQRQQVVDRMVEVSLLAQEAREKGLADDPKVQAQMATTQRLILARALVQQMSSDSEAVTEADVRAAYDERYGDAGKNVELKARHILVESPEKARELIKQLDEGADFAELAGEHSNGPTSKRGGDLGWFAADEMVPVFTEAAMDLEKGEYTGEPVQTRFGWHVIKLEDRRSSEPPAFEDVRQKLRNELANKQIADRIEALREEADIEIAEGWGGASADADQGDGDSASGKGGEK